MNHTAVPISDPRFVDGLHIIVRSVNKGSYKSSCCKIVNNLLFGFAAVKNISKVTANDKNIAAKFQKDPVGTIEELIGVDLPNDQIKALADGIKAKLDLEKLGGALGGLGGLFGKK